MEKKYQWPASAISKDEMAILVEERERSYIPINKLIKEVIRKQYGEKNDLKRNIYDPDVSF